ncbi:ATP-binding protein [Azospirillum sp. ST 5-10]|uniref:ATP-binding protein n=1 Tax=unclassified Azospirillum TaxID=2630922 RepID=UPI003F4A2E59
MSAEAPRGARVLCVPPDRIPDDQAVRVAARFGPAGGGTAPAAGIAVLLPHGCDRDRIAEALAGDAFYVVELGEDGGAPGDWSAVRPVEQGFFLSLTTATAFGIHIAVLVCDALGRRGVLAIDRRAPVELCLHEAVANAVVHGNLGVASAARDHPDGFRHYSRLVTERLADARLRQRRTELLVRWDGGGLEIAVADQGAGFEAAAAPAPAGGAAPFGRGLVFMRTLARRVAISDGGRCTTLRFDR